jgi:DNA-directed RNA polymerase specialized sigma24 family protein
MTEAEIKSVVKATISEMRAQGLLKDDIQQAYQTVAQRLKMYYEGKSDPKLAEVLDKLRNDVYFEVLTMYYRDGLKVEQIADIMIANAGTISRNKRRLCLEIYTELY